MLARSGETLGTSVVIHGERLQLTW